MIRIYIPEPFEGVSLAHWFAPLSKNANYTKDLPPNFFETEVERVTEPSQAQVIVLSNNFKDALTPAARAYIATYADLGAREGKPVLACSLGDFTEHVIFDPRVYVLRFSMYRDLASPRDICVPALTEDNAQSGIQARSKADRPIVSFCGMGDLATLGKKVAYYIKNLRYDVLALFNPNWRAHKIGVYWRRAMMRACSLSPLVDTHFIVRKTFSGSRKTIELDPAIARTEYLQSIVESDFVIAPKGDGNYSNRFFKTLCMGRFPVLVDTNIVLPLEEVIDYTRIIVRVPMKDVGKTPEYIRAFYDGLTGDELAARQLEARAVFERYLRQDAFLKYYFTTVLPTLS